MRSLNELYFRRNLANYIIGYLMENVRDDPRQPDAINEYRRQVEVIDAEILEVKKAQGWKKPAPTLVQLETAVLFGESQVGG